MEMYLELVSLKPALPLVAQTTILFSYFLLLLPQTKTQNKPNPDRNHQDMGQ